jgi:hypothetical protein
MIGSPRVAVDGALMARTTYQPLTPESCNPKLCHYCNECPIVAGLTLPNGVQVCKICYNKHAEKEAKKKKKQGLRASLRSLRK